MKCQFIAVLLWVGLCQTVPAATVNFILDLTGPEGTFQVLATSSAGDNAGLMLYGVELSGSIVNLEQASTAAVNAENVAGAFGSTGFTLLRLTQRGNGSVHSILASQDIVNSTPHLLYELGQRQGSLAELGIAPTTRVTSSEWDASFLLAVGLYEGDPHAVDINLDGVTLANVFTTAGLAYNEIADITKEIRRIDPVTGLVVSTGRISRPEPPVEPRTEESVLPSSPLALYPPSVDSGPTLIFPDPSPEQEHSVEPPPPAPPAGRLEEPPGRLFWSSDAPLNFDGSAALALGDGDTQLHAFMSSRGLFTAYAGNVAPWASVDGSTPAVPEPSTIFLALVGSAMAARPRRTP